MKDNLKYLNAKLEELKILKSKLSISDEEVEELKNPEEYLKNLGYDLSDLKNLSQEEISLKFRGLSKIADDLKKAGDDFGYSSLNKENSDSKAIENYFKK